MHPLKIVIILVLLYMIYRLYLSGRKKKLAADKERQGGQPALDDVLVQDPACGSYVPRGQALRLQRGGREFFFCSEKCRDAFAAGDADSAGGQEQDKT